MPLGDYITTFMGLEVYPLDPQPSMICLEDIAHALAHQCRFAGHTAKFYSVAEHCVHVSQRVDPVFAQAALMHDAAEAYLMDIPRPLKGFLWYCLDNQTVGPYKVYERRLLQVIINRFHMHWPWDGLPLEVTAADCRMLVTEYLALVSEVLPDDLIKYDPYVVSLGNLDPPAAKRAFLKRAKELGIRDYPLKIKG